jgi:hypothetical protein
VRTEYDKNENISIFFGMILNHKLYHKYEKDYDRD